MDKWQREVQRSLLKDEQCILRVLQMMYTDVLRETQDRASVFYNRVMADPADAAAVYQLRYQQALAAQLGAVLDGFEDRSYATITDYLEGCYTNGFVGAMYDIHRQGIPVIAPIRQDNVVRAITTDSKISVPMYTRLGNDIAQLKAAIAAEVTRGIASGHSWHDTAAGIARQGNVSAYNAMRIARTEGHRIACEGQMDGCREAKSAGADVVKEWSAAHDDRTRDHHRQLDGQLRELDADFEVDGIRVPFPGAFGRPEEDIHCRCALLQRARWALSGAELERLRETPEAKALAETEGFAEFKGKYLEMARSAEKDITGTPTIPPSKYLTNAKDSVTIKTDERFDLHPDKINRFLLLPGAKHSQDFFDVGYKPDDYEKLFDDIARSFDIEKAVQFRQNPKGKEGFSIFMELGVTKKRTFRTTWEWDGKGSKPRFTSAYRNDGKNRK